MKYRSAMKIRLLKQECQESVALPARPPSIKFSFGSSGQMGMPLALDSRMVPIGRGWLLVEGP